MQHGTQTAEVTDGLRRSLSSSFVGSAILLWRSDDLLLLGVVVVLVALSLLTEPGKKASMDRAMAAMAGGTIGGFLGASASLLMAATWHQATPPQAMSIMTASMAGMIGGALGGSWRLFFVTQRPSKARSRRIG